MISDIEQDIRRALGERAAEVPELSVDVVRHASYSPRMRALAPRTAVVGVLSGAVVAVFAVALLSLPRGTTGPSTGVKATPVAYVGSAPRLSVTVLPDGFQPGPDIPIPVVSGAPADPGVLPDKTFVRGNGPSQQSIIIAEGMNGSGPVAKLLDFAAANPSAVTTTTSNGRKLTVVDLAAAGAGSGDLIYFPVGSTAWAMLSGSPGLSEADLISVAEGITYEGS